jgi:sirohydrochlorin ferrochelatase
MHTSPVLLVIAHGSRDPRHAATVHALVRRVRSLRPGVRVETGFLDFNVPSVRGVLESLAAEGVRDVVALPLLLTRAFHAKSDIPAVLRQAPGGLAVRQAEVLGPSPLLLAGLERRLYEAGLDPADKASTGVVLASAGSSDPEAIAVIAEIAREWRHTGWCAVRPAFASAELPRTEAVVRELRAAGCRRVAVAPYGWSRSSPRPSRAVGRPLVFQGRGELREKSPPTRTRRRTPPARALPRPPRPPPAPPPPPGSGGDG